MWVLLILIPYEFQLSILAESYHSSRRGECVGDTLHNVVDFFKKNKKTWSLIPVVMSLVKIILVMPALNVPLLKCTEKGKVLSPYNHVEQPSQSSYGMHTWTVHKELVKELNFKQVTNDFVDRVESCLSNLWPLFHIAVIAVDKCLCLSI